MSRPALIAIVALVLAAVIITVARVSPRVSRTLLRWAVRRCFDTDELRERFAEEWLADLEDVPGRLAKLAHTAGVLLLAAAPIWVRSCWRRSRLARRLDRAPGRPGPGLAVTGAGGGAVLARAGALALALAVAGLVAVPSVASTLRLFQAWTAPSAAAAAGITGLLNPHGPAPGSLTCPTATTCYDRADPVSPGGVPGLQAPGRLYVSTDGARTWQDIPLSSGLTFTTALACQTAQICSAGAEDHGKPAFTSTQDGGRTWTTSPLPVAAGVITRLSCPAATTCRALAATVTRTRFGSRVLTMLTTTDHLVTTDDGRHFTTTTFPAGDNIRLLSCPTASHCVAVGPRLTLVSDAGGGTWHPGMLPRGVQPWWGPLGCVDAQHCFQVAQRMNDSVLMVSDDGGATWQLRPFPARYPDPGITSLACVSVSTCYISGWDDAPQSFDNGNATSGSTPIAAVTQDAGLTWQGISLPGPSSLPLPSGEPPDVFMSLVLQCPTASTCIALADDVAGHKHAAIYTTTGSDLVNGGASGWAIAGALPGDLATIFVGAGLVHMARRRLRRRREASSMTATAGTG
jgi:hypothetical protein